MKQMKNGINMLVAGGLFLCVMSLSSCSKEAQTNSSVQDDAQDISDLFDKSAGCSIPDPTLVNWWKFNGSFTETLQSLNGTPYSGATFGPGVSQQAFLSPNNGYVTYPFAGTALNNITTGFAVDFWVYATPKEGGAQCIFAIAQAGGAFWPAHHVLLDDYNMGEGDSALIKVMFKANKPIPYNEQWTVIGGIPNFYNRWTRVQYAYYSCNSKFYLKINNKFYVNGATLYTTDPALGGQPLGLLAPNPEPCGMVIGQFQNVTPSTLPCTFNAPEAWMLPFTGSIDELKFYRF